MRLLLKINIIIYGSSRIGVRSPDLQLASKKYIFIGTSGQLLLGTPGVLTATVASTENFMHVIGQKVYELSNHLGNVLVTVADARMPVAGTGPLSSTVVSYSAMVVSATDYSAFGAPMPGRQFSSANYRYGFNGKEKDDEITGSSGTDYDFGARMYDARLGRFLSVDPLTRTYPQSTPYSFAANSPIQFIDYNGEAPGDPITPGQVRDKLNDGKTVKGYSITLYVDQPVHGSSLPINPNTGDVGHAFISITKYNVDGTMTTANFGWYPDGGLLDGSPLYPTAPGTLKDDSGHPYDAAISLHDASLGQVNSVLDFTDSYSGNNYNLAGCNCSTFAVEAATTAGLNVPQTIVEVPATGQGLTPGQLGFDIQTGQANVQPAGGSVSTPSSEQIAYDFTNTGSTFTGPIPAATTAPTTAPTTAASTSTTPTFPVIRSAPVRDRQAPLADGN